MSDGRQPRIVCIGGANIDTKAKSLQPIRFQESNPVTVKRTSGGVARNIAENVAQLGAATSLLTIVGDDPDGKLLLDDCKRCGIDVGLSIVMPGEATGTYTAVLDHAGEMVVALAGMHIFDRFTIGMLASRWSAVAAADWVMADTNITEEALRYVIERCGQDQLPLCINPVSAVKVRKLPQQLAGVTLIVANRNEAEVLTGVGISGTEDAYRACERLLRAGVKQAVITMGQEGAVWSSGEGSGHHLPPIVQVADVTGAGDALMAGVLCGLLQHEPLETACRWGMSAAALTIQSDRTVAKLSAERVKEMSKPHAT